MRTGIFFLFLIFPLLQSCSVTKDVPKQSIGLTIQSKPTESNVEDSRRYQELLLIARSSDLKDIETQLKKFSTKDLNFQDTTQGSDLLALLIESNNIEKLRLFLKAGLSIYHKETHEILTSIHLEERKEAVTYLNRFSSKNIPTNENPSSFTEVNKLLINSHSAFIARIEELLRADKVFESKALAKESRISCKDLTFSLVLRSIRQEQRKISTQIERLLTALNCAETLNAEETNILYVFEIKKLFQEKSLETSLIKYLFKSQSLGDSMIALGESGIRLSPWKLLEISKTCTFNPKDINKNTDAYETISKCHSNQDPSQCDQDNKDARDECISKFGLPVTPFDFTYTQENLRVASIQHLVIGNGELTGLFPAQVTDYMYGFSNNEKKWKASLDFELSRNPLEDL